MADDAGGASTAVLAGTSAILVLSILFAYAPVLTSTYGIADDYWYLDLARTAPGAIREFQFLQGRPLGGVLLSIAFPAVSSVEELWLLRLVGIVFICLLAVLTFVLLHFRGVGTFESAIVALSCTLVPTFQVYAAWAVCFPYALAAIAGLLGGWIAVTESIPTPRRVLSGTLLVLAGCAVYQPAAMMCWTIPAYVVLRSTTPGTNAIRVLGVTAAICGTALVLDYLLAQLGSAIYGLSVESRAVVTSSPFAKLIWFVTSPTRHLAIPWMLRSSHAMSIGAAILLVVGIWHYHGRQWNRVLAALGVSAALLMAAHLPNLLSADSWTSLRSLGAPVSISVIVWWVALAGYVRRWPVGGWLRPTAVLCVASLVLLAREHVRRNVVAPQEAEWRFVQRSLVTNLLSDPSARRVGFVRPQWFEGFAPRTIADEIGLPSSTQPGVPTAMSRAVLRESGLADRGIEIVETTERRSWPAGTLVIDPARRSAEIR